MSIADKLLTAAENVQRVYEAGRNAEHSKFWDAFQENGSRATYSNTFYGWRTDCLYPKYDLKPTGNASYMFRDVYGTAIDLVERFKECGIEFSTKEATDFGYGFYHSNFTHLPEIDLTKCANVTRILGASSFLVAVDKVIFKDDGSQPIASAFDNLANLENITFEGVIGKNGFDIHWSTKLNKASIISIINALSDTTAGLSVTMSLSAVNAAFETSDGAKDGSRSDEWLNLAATKPNWTISLV